MAWDRGIYRIPTGNQQAIQITAKAIGFSLLPGQNQMMPLTIHRKAGIDPACPAIV